MDIAARLKELREDAGLSQKQLAAKSGVGEKTISSFESKRRTDTMKLGQLWKILDVLGMSFTEFFVPEGATVPHAEETGAFDLFDRFMALPSEKQMLLLPVLASLVLAMEHTGNVRRVPVDPLAGFRQDEAIAV
jgi:transcriptional regulator with XRE-family HTH domain